MNNKSTAVGGCNDKEIKDLMQNQDDLIKKLECKEIDLRENK